jgi:hypothetical protein
MAMGRVVEVTSYRRDDGVTVKRGEWALEEADGRREAWYVRLGAWKAAEGDEEAETVGDDEASMSMQASRREVLGLRLEREMPAAIAQDGHSRRYRRGEGGAVERTGAAEAHLAWQKKDHMPPPFLEHEAWLGPR